MITNADCPCLVLAKYTSPPYTAIFVAAYVDDDNYAIGEANTACVAENVTKICLYKQLVETFPEGFI